MSRKKSACGSAQLPAQMIDPDNDRYDLYSCGVLFYIASFIRGMGKYIDCIDSIYFYLLIVVYPASFCSIVVPLTWSFQSITALLTLNSPETPVKNYSIAPLSPANVK